MADDPTVKATSVVDLRIHDLRRSLGSWQTGTGSNSAIVGKTLGHSRPETTAIYSRVNLETVRTSMETATAAILAVATAKNSRAKNKPRTCGAPTSPLSLQDFES